MTPSALLTVLGRSSGAMLFHSPWSTCLRSSILMVRLLVGTDRFDGLHCIMPRTMRIHVCLLIDTLSCNMPMTMRIHGLVLIDSMACIASCRGQCASTDAGFHDR